MWLSSGGTKSVVHYDVGDNMNCLLSGRKRMALWSSDLRDKIEAHGMGWVNHELDPTKHQTYASPFNFRSAMIPPFDFRSAVVPCPTHAHFCVKHDAVMSVRISQVWPLCWWRRHRRAIN